MRIGKVEIQNTRTLVGPDTRLCTLIYAPSKFGKTELASGLDDVTRKYRGKPTLTIAVEVAEGGGTMTVARKGIDYVTPANWSDMEAIIAELGTNDYYGGLIVDNLSDYIVRIVRPYALKFPPKENAVGAREHGVPGRSDYQVMAECARQQLNKLMNLSNKNTPDKYRKDIIMTALEKDKNDEQGNLESIKPALPGALADVVTAMFNSVVSIKIKQKIVKDAESGQTRKVSGRVLHVRADGVRITDDRMGMWPHDFALTDDNGGPVGLLAIYERWLATLPPPAPPTVLAAQA